MRFCTKCDNMYNMKISEGDDSNELIHYCRNCGNEDTTVDSTNVCISTTVYNGDTNASSSSKTDSSVDHNVVYAKHDPTLPRTDKIKCPNKDCASNAADAANAEVVYSRYNDKDMKYMYVCCKCDTSWKF